MLLIYSANNPDLTIITAMLSLVVTMGIFRLFEDMEWFLTAILVITAVNQYTFTIVLTIPPSNTRDGMLVSEIIAVTLTVFAVAGFFGLLSKGMSAAQKKWFKKVDDDPLSSLLDDLDKQAQPQP